MTSDKSQIKEFNVLIHTDDISKTLYEIEKRIIESLPEMDLIQLNGMTTRWIKIDVKWQNGNEWNPYLDKKEKENKEWIRCSVCKQVVVKQEYCAYCECELKEIEK